MQENSGALRIDSETEPFFTEKDIDDLRRNLSEQIIAWLPEGAVRDRFIRLFDPWPDWALDILGKYIGTYFSTLKPKEITKEIRSVFQGRFHALDHLTQSKIMGHAVGGLKFLESKQASEDLSAEHIKVIFKPIKEHILKYLELILSLPKAESEKCLTAFSKAYSNTFTEIGEPKGLKTNRPILWALIFRWPVIEKMPSVGALHRYLHEVLPANLVGDQKRLEAICRQHKIKFRKRGRPKKSESLI